MKKGETALTQPRLIYTIPLDETHVQEIDTQISFI